MNKMFINLYHYLNICIVLLSFDVKLTCSTQFTNDRKRIGSIDWAMAEHDCLKKFTVKENTIIRTQDSRLLGAKFLNESDTGNREDCLTFCCNTRFCNVAVFQEKSSFSCYLFDCGPPEHLLCKFTSHSYYTSAILTVNRNQLDLGEGSSQIQHEAELTDLRYTPDRELQNVPSNRQKEQVSSIELKSESLSSAKVIPSPITTSTTESSTNLFLSSTIKSSTQSESVNKRKCSKIQFECHSGECIAIYNACDGIPQCVDGSDEGKELACPQGKCSQIQFECHSEECIAIYNTCDGIPQCVDGSDEGKELACPHGKSVEGTTNDSDSLKSIGRIQNDQNWNDRIGQPPPPSPPQRRKYGPERGVFNHRTNLLEYNHYPNDVSPDYAREESLGYGGHGKGPGYYDYPQRPPPVPKYNIVHQDGIKGEPSAIYHHDYPDYSLINRQQELQQIPNQHSRQQQIYPIQTSQQYPSQHRSGSPQIYHQAEGQHWQGTNQQYSPYQVVPQNIPHIQHYEDTLRDSSQMEQPIGTSRDENLHMELKYNQMPRKFKEETFQNELLSGPNNSPGTQANQQMEENNKDGGRSSAINESISKTRTEDTRKSSKVENSNDMATSNISKPSQIAEDLKNKEVEKSSKVDGAQNDVKTISTKTEQSSEPVLVHASVSRLSVNVEELEREDQNQKAQTSGAILALSLGMSITILLIVLVGCRIRKVKRRARRRRGGLRSPLEHDVDYLVNGMYL